MTRTLLAAFATVLLLGFGCGGDPASPEAQVRAALDALEQAAEAGDAAAPSLHLDEVMIRSRIEAQCAECEHGCRLAARTANQGAKPCREPGKAEVTLHAGLAGRGQARLRADVYKLDLDLEEEDSGLWRVVWAQWRPAPAADLL